MKLKNQKKNNRKSKKNNKTKAFFEGFTYGALVVASVVTVAIFGRNKF